LPERQDIREVYMKIVICDDSIEDLLKIEKMLLKYQKIYPGTEFEVEKYSDPYRLYRILEKRDLAEIYILDMIMPQKTGIDLGNQIRKAGSGNVIIYITTSDDYALDAYGVHAARYLLKPVSENKIFEALGYALASTCLKKEPAFLVRTKGGLVSLPYSRIAYIENSARRLGVHLVDGELVTSILLRGTFEEAVRNIAGDRRFLQVHKSFLVNLDYVRRVDGDEVVMEKGKKIPISRAKAANVKKEYLLFVSEK